jgi:hypothetical protein
MSTQHQVPSSPRTTYFHARAGEGRPALRRSSALSTQTGPCTLCRVSTDERSTHARALPRPAASDHPCVLSLHAGLGSVLLSSQDKHGSASVDGVGKYLPARMIPRGSPKLGTDPLLSFGRPAAAIKLTVGKMT